MSRSWGVGGALPVLESGWGGEESSTEPPCRSDQAGLGLQGLVAGAAARQSVGGRQEGAWPGGSGLRRAQPAGQRGIPGTREGCGPPRSLTGHQESCSHPSLPSAWPTLAHTGARKGQLPPTLPEPQALWGMAAEALPPASGEPRAPPDLPPGTEPQGLASRVTFGKPYFSETLTSPTKGSDALEGHCS